MQYTKHADGSYTFTGGGQSFTVDSLEKSVELSEIAEANSKALLSELLARTGSVIHSHVIEGRTWHLLEMDQFAVNEVGIRLAATGHGSRLIKNNEVFKALILAVLQVGVVKGKDDDTPYFNPEPYRQKNRLGKRVNISELEVFCSLPSTGNTVAQLFDVLTDLNPSTWPEKKVIEAMKTE